MTQTPLVSAPERRETRRGTWVVASVCACAVVLVLLYLLSRSNYLLFHGIIELFGIVVCFAIFVVAWNTRKLVANDFVLFLGVAFLFVAVVDLFHTLAYRGMGVFPGFTSNQPTQFWILARYIQAFSLLLAPLFLSRCLRLAPVAAVYSLVTGFGLLSICRLGIFPDCFIEGQGLTAFKVASEYVISAMLVGGIILLARHRSSFEPRIVRLLVGAMAAAIAGEMAFTLYTDVYGVANMVGHLFKASSFYLIYRAVVVTSLATPYSLLFRELAQERDRAQSYLDIAGVILIALDRDGRVQLINRKGAEVLGRAESEILGRDWFQDFLPDSRRSRARELFAVMMSGGLEGAEYAEGPVATRDGGERVIAWHNAILRDADGAVSGMLSSGEDVTERRVAERAQEASERRFRLLFDRAPDGYYLSDLQGRFVDANLQAEALVGYRKEQLLGKSFFEAGLLRPQDVPVAAALLGRSLQGLPTGPDELTLVHKDGSTGVVEIRTEPVELEGRTLVLGIARDVTERKRAEDALRESESRFRSLVDNTGIGVLTVSSADRILDCNSALTAMVGYTREELLGRNVADLYVRPGDRDLVREELLRSRCIRAREVEYRRSDGVTLFVNLTSAVVRLDGQDVFMSQVSDITERKRVEDEILRSEARLRSLVGILQHESATVQEFLDHALNEAIALTESRMGYIYFYDEERKEFTLNTWSREVMKECTIQEARAVYQLEKTGIWGEVVRQRRAIVVNDFSAPHPLKKGYPEGHAKLHRYASMPVLSAGRIVAVVGVANKESDYTDTDVLQLTLLMDSVWKEVTRKQALEQVRRFSERLERAMSAGSLAWWQMTLPSGDVLFDARKATALGYRPSDFSHYRDFTALLHPDDNEKTMQAMRDHLEGRAERYEAEYRMRTATGLYRWLRDVGSVTQRDESDRPSVVTGIVVDITNLKETEERLVRSNVELQELAARLDVAREEERAAVAWELHDQIAQALSVMKMDVVSCGRKLPAGALGSVQPSLDKMIGLLDDTIARLRRLYTDLVPVMLEDLGLAATIEWQAEEFRRQTGIDVEVGRVENLKLPDERTELGVFRVLQEALENALHHAGATRVKVDFAPEDGHAVLRVADNGPGLPGTESGAAVGRELAGIRERARSWGGEVSVSASASEGAVLRVTVPLARD